MATQYTAGLTTGEVLTAATMNSLGAVSETFTPAWTSTGTQPNIGNGTLTGRYFRIQKLVFVQIFMITGSTTTYGTGIYYWSLPFNSRTGLYGYMSNGVARTYDISTATATLGQSIFYGTTDKVVVFLPNGIAGQTTPMTWAAGDEAVIALWYEAA